MAGLHVYKTRLKKHEEHLKYLGAVENEDGTWDYASLYDILSGGYRNPRERKQLIKRHARLQFRVEDIESRPLCIICGKHTRWWDLDEDDVCKRKACKREFGRNEVVR